MCLSREEPLLGSCLLTRCGLLYASDVGYSVRRRFVDEFFFRHVAALAVGSRVLDLGGNRVGKRGRFDIGRCDLRIVYANLSIAKRPDVQADAICVPLRDGCFNAVICSELLEHVPEPLTVLREIHRVLAVGGTLLACAPFLYRVHGDPHDYGRYTGDYWLQALSASGLRLVAIERHGLFYSVLVDFCKQYVDALWHRPLRDMARVPLAVAQGMALRCERTRRVQSHPFLRSFTTGFGIVAVKG
jgi:SAM-dependent methyltransferase